MNEDMKYILDKNLFDLNELKTELLNKVKIYKGFFTSFPKNPDMAEKILRNELRLTIVELNCELMSLEYQIKDIQSELLTYNN